MEKREILLEENDAVYVGRCESCSGILFEGDKACRIEDAGYLCEACSPTWAEGRRDWESGKADIDPEDFDEAVAIIEARIAAGEGDVKMVSPL